LEYLPENPIPQNCLPDGGSTWFGPAYGARFRQQQQRTGNKLLGIMARINQFQTKMKKKALGLNEE
jgi:hypothetical protein